MPRSWSHSWKQVPRWTVLECILGLHFWSLSGETFHMWSHYFWLMVQMSTLWIRDEWRQRFFFNQAEVEMGSFVTERLTINHTKKGVEDFLQSNKIDWFMQTNMNSTLSPETRPNLNLLTKKENLPNIPSIYDSVMQPIETTQGTDKQLFFAPTNVSSDFGSAEQQL